MRKTHTTQASCPQPFGTLARKGWGQNGELGVGGLWAMGMDAVGRHTGLGAGPLLVSGR